MPFFLKKSRGKNAYWVVNKITGKKYSHEPLPHETALKQMRALYAQENGYKLDLKEDLNEMKGGSDSPEDSPEDIAKQLLLNLRMKAEADTQTNEAHNDGNYLSGGYGGTDETIEQYGNLNWSDYKKSLWEEIVDFVNTAIDAIHNNLDKIGLGDAFMAVVHTVGSFGTILGDVFTGKFENLKEDGGAILIALDEIAKQIPVVNVVDGVAHIIDKAVKGEQITIDDFTEVGNAINDSIASLATAGSARAALGIIRKEAKDAVKETIKGALQDAVKESIMNKFMGGSPEEINEAVTKVLFNHYVQTHPNSPVYRFHSQITGHDRNVLLHNISGVEIPEGIDRPNSNFYSVFNYLKMHHDMNKNLDDPRLLKYIFRYEGDIHREFYDPYATDLTTKHTQVTQDMINEDNAKISDEAYPAIKEKAINFINIEDIVKDVKEHPEKYIDKKDGWNFIWFRGYSPWHWYGRDIYGDGVIRRDEWVKLPDFIRQLYLEVSDPKNTFVDRAYIINNIIDDYKILVKADKDKLESVFMTYDNEIKKKLDEYDKADNEFIETAINELNKSKDDISNDILDEIFKQIADAGGSLTTDMYNQLKNIADNTLGQDLRNYASTLIKKAQLDKYLADGIRLNDDEESKLIDDLKNGLAKAVHDDVLTQVSKITYNEKDKELSKLKENYDSAIAQINSLNDELNRIGNTNYVRKHQIQYDIIPQLLPIISDYENKLYNLLAIGSQNPLELFKKTIGSRKTQIQNTLKAKYDIEDENKKKSRDDQESTLMFEWSKTHPRSLAEDKVPQPQLPIVQETQLPLEPNINDYGEDLDAYNAAMDTYMMELATADMQNNEADTKLNEDMIKWNDKVEEKYKDLFHHSNEYLKIKDTWDKEDEVIKKNREKELADEFTKAETIPTYKPKTVDDIKRELGLVHTPALAKQPVKVIQPPVVSSQTPQKIQPALSRNVPVAPTIITPQQKPVEPSKVEPSKVKIIEKTSIQNIPAIERELNKYDVKPYVVSKHIHPNNKLFGKHHTSSHRRVGR